VTNFSDDINLKAPSNSDPTPGVFAPPDEGLVVQGKGVQGKGGQRPGPSQPDDLLTPRHQWARDRHQAQIKTHNLHAAQKFEDARTYSPRFDARVARIAKESGISMDLIESGDNVEFMEMMLDRRKFSALLDANYDERLAQVMLDPNFLKLAHDDYENLFGISKTAAHWRAGRLGHEMSLIGFRMMRGEELEGDYARLKEIRKMMASLPRDSSGEGLLGLWYGGVRMLAGTAEIMGSAALAGVTAGSIATPAAGVWASALTMGTGTSMVEGGAQYLDLVEMGVDPEIAFSEALSTGAISGVLEAGGFGFGAGAVIGKVATGFTARRAAAQTGKRLIPNTTAFGALGTAAGGWARGMAGEQFAELSQTIVQHWSTQEAIEKSADREGLDLEGQVPLAEQLEETFWETFRGAFILSSFAPAIQLTSDLGRARNAGILRDRLTNMGGKIEKSKVREREPDALVDFLEQALEDTDQKTLFFDVEKFKEQMDEAGLTEEQLENRAPEIAQRLKDAEKTGELEIPTSEFGAKFFAEGFGKNMIPHARTEAGGMSFSEIQEMLGEDVDVAELAEEGERLLEEAEIEVNSVVEQVAEIRKRVYDQSIAAGFDPEKARVISHTQGNILTALAERANMTPAQFDKLFPVKIRLKDEAAPAGEALGAPVDPEYEAAERRLREASFAYTKEKNRSRPVSSKQTPKGEAKRAEHAERLKTLLEEREAARADLETQFPDYKERRVTARDAFHRETMARQAQEEAAFWEGWKEQQAAKPEMAQVRRKLQSGLRGLGLRMERSEGGSNYYSGTLPNGERITVRVSDHEVPMTPAREAAREEGRFTWAEDGGQQFIISPESTAEEVASFIDQLTQQQLDQLNFEQPADLEFNEADFRPEVVSWAKDRFGDRVAPNGKPAWQNFVAWFGDSQVVDEKGAPQTLYRGLRFPPEGGVMETREGRATLSLTDNPDVANVYSKTKTNFLRPAESRPGSMMVAAHVKMEKPLDLSRGSQTSRLMKGRDVLTDYRISMVEVFDAVTEGSLDLSDNAHIGMIIDSMDDMSGMEFTGQGETDWGLAKTSDGYDIDSWVQLQDTIQELFEDGEFEEIAEILAEVTVDQFFLADTESFIDAIVDGFGWDGVIINDLFSGGAPYYEGSKELGLAPDDEPTAKVWRPIDQRQIKSITNIGTYDPESQSMLKQPALDQVSEPDSKPPKGDLKPGGKNLKDGNALGFWPRLRVKAPTRRKLPKKGAILTGTNNKNAQRQIDAIDSLLENHPNAHESASAWANMLAEAFGSQEVPVPPYAFIRDLVEDRMKEKLDTLSEGQLEDADRGFENAREFRRAYIAGEIDVATTGKLFLWSFLSRGVSPYTQESLFIDSFDGAATWIDKAARGEFTEADFDAYTEWAKSVSPKGSGQPGASSTHNLNAFGRSFLFKMGQRRPDGRTHLQYLHDMMADPDMTGQQIRREFQTFGEGVGIDNKVVSFTLLVAGFDDVMVLDRVQVRQLWDDGRFNGYNLYDGINETRVVKGKEKRVKITGSSLTELTMGARGILIYEAIERAISAKVEGIYAELGRPQDASIGRYHWESWVADSQQEASHGTLEAVLKDAKGQDHAIAQVTAKEGEYGAYEYGALYGRDKDGTPYFLYEVPDGTLHRFTVPQFRAFLGTIKKPGTGVVPKGFKVRQAGNQPWYFSDGINRERLEEVAHEFDEGRRTPDASLREEGTTDARGVGAERGPALDQPATAPLQFFSALARGIAGHDTKVATASGWKQALKSLLKKGEVKKDEIFWTGLEEWLDLQEGKITEEQIAEYLEGSGVKVEGGAPLFAPGESRGQYVPSSMDILLSKDADVSTVLHELNHHYVHSMLSVANMQDAPKEILEDVDTMMRWWKVAGDTAEERLANWNAMSFAEQAPHHEALAYNYELWLFTGTAPTVGIRKLFERIRTFMIGVYTSLVEAQRKLSGAYRSRFGRDLPSMNPEIRDLFERMVAGEQGARNAEAVRSMAPIFESLESWKEFGGTESTWKEYQERIREWRQKLQTDLSVDSARAMGWQKNAEGRVLREIVAENKEKRKATEKEITAEVEREPIYQVLALFKKDKTGLDRDSVLAMLGDLDEDAIADIKKKLGRNLRARKKLKGGQVEIQGLMPDFVAEFFGFETGEELVRTLIAARPIKEEIDIRTTALMEARYGNLNSEEAIQHRIEQAIHNEARARFVAAELKFLEGSTRPARLKVGAAREAARKILAGTRIGDIDPRKYAQLEARAARAAKQAMKAVKPRKAHTTKEGVERKEIEGRDPDPQAAITAKEQELLYGQLTKLALEVKDEVSKAQDTKKFTRSDSDLRKTRDVNIVHVARAVLAQYGLLPPGAAGRTADFIGRLREYSPEMFAVYEEQLAKAQVAGETAGYDYRNMTLDEFRAMTSMVNTLWFRSKRDKEIESEGKREKLAEIVATLADILEGRRREKIPGQESGLGDKHRVRVSVLQSAASLVKLEHYLRYLDGGKQGEFTHYLYNEVKEAINNYRADASIYTKKFVEMLEDLRKDGLLDDQAIPSHELGYVFGGPESDVGGLTELIGALLHMGNAGNKSKFLVGGRGDGKSWAFVNEDGDIDYTKWNAFIERMINEGRLNKKHFDFVQNVWNLMEEIKPKLQAAHIKLMGHTFKEVQAEAFEITFKDGTTVTYRGGYVPATPDTQVMREVGTRTPVETTLETLEEGFKSALPKVPDGMTKERADEYRENPLSMHLDMILAHIDKSLRYAHVQPAAKDMERIITNERFKKAMHAVDPDAIDQLFLPFLDRAVTQSLYKEGHPLTQMFFKHFRRIAGVKIMAGNVVNTLQQFTGLINATLYVKPHHVRNGLWQMLTNRRELMDLITSKSKFMDDRLRNQMFELSDEMREIVLHKRGLKGKGKALQRKGLRWGYILQSTAQNMVDISVWKGAFEQVMEAPQQGESMAEQEARAVIEADQAVRLSQGSFSPEDVAGYEKGTAAGRAWTQFTSYFNTVLNQVVFAQEGDKIKTALIAFSAPMIVAQAIAMTLWGQWDDEDDDGHVDTAWDLLGGSQWRGAFAMFPAFGPAAVQAIDALFEGRQFGGDRVAAPPATAALTRSVLGTAYALNRAWEGDKDLKSSDVRDVMSLIIISFPYGGAALAPLGKSIGYGTQMGLGEVEPTGPFDMLRGFASGRASEGTRQ